ncbi:hypothetical protein ES288_D12G027300v1 [Gossypium darwinii]|uniref:Alpha/beta hydrolase fold-3 domain-containing protein n=1 Tax=Gossypium darwinii TaxID=34276 RepID=A0A5D2A557_GOSDA|nr:hypothetical protein ES288_D12G027300v1 [Gossypium darwinii]
MDSSSNEVIRDCPPFFKVYKDGRVERYFVTQPVPAGLDPTTGVQTKDVVISPAVKARIFMPQSTTPGQKLPLLVHYHGGGFSIGSAFDTFTYKVAAPLAKQANIVLVSIDYRLAPEHPLPIAHDDSWVGLQWVASHANGQGPEPWLNDNADPSRVFLAGESAGANIAHFVAVQAGVTKLVDLKIRGMLIVHPYFGTREPSDNELDKYVCPTSTEFDNDPIVNPAADPKLNEMACERVIVLVAEEDGFRNRGEAYYETLAKSGWRGKVEFFETKGEGHCFHVVINNHNTEVLKNKMVDFINKDI